MNEVLAEEILKAEREAQGRSNGDKRVPEGKKKKEPSPEHIAHFEGLVDLALDSKGDVVFLVLAENGLETNAMYKVGETVYLPPGREVLPFDLPLADNVKTAYQNEDAGLFDDLLAYLRRFSYLPAEQWVMVACKVMSTYLADHPDIYYLPMILFFAVPERGKSRTGKAVTLVSYRGVHVVDMRRGQRCRGCSTPRKGPSRI
jgi:hypothetical protein